jgi:hypothetical protein
MISPMGSNPQAYGIEVLRSWPWSSLLEFRVLSQLIEIS